MVSNKRISRMNCTSKVRLFLSSFCFYLDIYVALCSSNTILLYNRHLEVSDVFEVSRMELLDFITVLSIFLDNAIEASLDSSTKEVNVALISGETKVVIVENTIAQESINTVGIFKLGRSSKGEGLGYSGIGITSFSDVFLGKKEPNTPSSALVGVSTMPDE